MPDQTTARDRAMLARRNFLMLLSGSALAGCQTAGLDAALQQALSEATGSGALGDGEIARGLKEALNVGTARVVAQVGRPGGYFDDPAIRIPLPDDLRRAHEVLEPLGLGRYTAEVGEKMNRAAEKAAPEARDVFWQAIAEMTIDDARGIWKGPDDAATRYFRGKMTPRLTERYTPIVVDALSEVGAIRAWDRMTAKYRAVPYVPDIKTDLTRYAVRESLDGLFHYVAREEAAIRHDPAKRTTALLRRVFGALA